MNNEQNQIENFFIVTQSLLEFAQVLSNSTTYSID